MPTWCAGSATPTDGWIAPGPRTGNSPSWPPASRGCSGTGPGSPPPGDEDDKSPVTGDCHAGICGSRGLQCPRLPDPALVVQNPSGQRAVHEPVQLETFCIMPTTGPRSGEAQVTSHPREASSYLSGTRGVKGVLCDRAVLAAPGQAGDQQEKQPWPR